MTRQIRQIHPFGPPVGKWTIHGTVAETIARARRELAEQQRKQNVTVIPKRKEKT